MTQTTYTDPAFVAAVSAGLVAIIGATSRVFTGRWVFFTKKPTPQDQLDKAVTMLIQHYQATLEQEKARYRDHVDTLNEEVNVLRGEVRGLRRLLHEHGLDDMA